MGTDNSQEEAMEQQVAYEQAAITENIQTSYDDEETALKSTGGMEYEQPSDTNSGS
jgi:hypothetical protein